MPQTLQVEKTVAKKSSFRPEIQGLRALAVLLVAAYHFWLGRVSGGVDIFLLISAFLMTGSFARKIERGQKIGFKALVDYWTHTFKRILPLATITVLLVLLGTWYFLPAPRWSGIADEAKSVVLYRENWWSIHNMVDYYAADSSAASPLRHFWSLSVQGQIFILWPLIFMLGWIIYRILGRGARPILALLFGAVFAWSLFYSIHLTATDQQIAYFSTWTRLWEFALGSLLAVVLPWIKLSRAVKRVIGWAGVIAILSCGLILDVEGQFPGYAALWPTLAAAAVILSNGSDSKYSAEHFLSHPALLWLGKYSYGLYLIHWPLLVFYLFVANREKASAPAGFLLLAVSIALSFLLTNLVEKPLRSVPWFDARAWRAALVVATCSTMVVTASNAWTGYNLKQNEKAIAQAATDNPGAAVLDANYIYQGSDNPTLIPVRTTATDWADIGPECSAVGTSLPETVTQNGICNVLHQSENPEKTVIAIGNSHMQMWSPALREIAEKNNWSLYLVTKGGCFAASEDIPEDANYDDCMVASNAMTEAIDTAHPDLVILTGTLSTRGAEDTVTQGIEHLVQHITSQNIPVVGIRDTPRVEVEHSDCVVREKESIADCGQPAGQDVNADPQQAIAQKYPLFGAVNMSDVVCPENNCPVEIGNVYVYQDYDHINSTYVKTTTSFFSDRFAKALTQTTP